MYVSQEIATALYTILKTLLLILLTQIICCICAWINRYDLAKIFEQGNITVLIGLITTKNYSKYKSLIIYLLFALSLQIVINFLPNIANHFMPFRDVLFLDNYPTYFNSNFSTPMQNVLIKENQTNMDLFCQNMGLCDTMGNYYGKIANISKDIEVNRIDYDFVNDQFSNQFLNISLRLKNNNYTYNVNKGIYTYVINDVDTQYFSFYLNEYLNMYMSGYNISKTKSYQTLIGPTVYNGFSLGNVVSVLNNVDIVYADNQNYVVLITKLAYYYGDGKDDKLEAFNEVFNNSEYLVNDIITLQRSRLYSDIGYAFYDNGKYLATDIIQYRYGRANGYISKARLLVSAYVIKDKNINNIKNKNEIKTINNYNFTYSTALKDINSVNSAIFNHFDDSPSNDIFTYVMLSGSDIMYGLQGYRSIVADISPIFIGIMVSIIVLLIIVDILSRIIKDKQYFNTLLENIGINNLPKIEKEDDVLLNNLEDEKTI